MVLWSEGVLALEFRELENGDLIARGEVELNDAEKLRSIITLPYRQKHGLVRFAVTVHFDSPGGSLVGGLRLGAALRESGNVWAVVDKEAGCYSACAWAFLGAIRRSVAGEYGVHASSIETRHVSETGAALDSVQMLSSISVAYARDMVGSSEIADIALSTPSGGIKVLSDSDLVRMRVITDAVRPSQFGNPTFSCRTSQLPIVQRLVCANTKMSVQDRQIAEHYDELQKLAPDLLPAGEQQRWVKYRDSCQHDSVPNGVDGIRWCLMSAYDIRARQLEGRLMDAKTRKEFPVQQEWQPHEPMCPQDGTPC